MKHSSFRFSFLFLFFFALYILHCKIIIKKPRCLVFIISSFPLPVTIYALYILLSFICLIHSFIFALLCFDYRFVIFNLFVRCSLLTIVVHKKCLPLLPSYHILNIEFYFISINFKITVIWFFKFNFNFRWIIVAYLDYNY